MILEAARQQRGRNKRRVIVRTRVASPTRSVIRTTHDIVVIGASAGGVEALTDLFSRLHPELRASFFVVMHLSPHGESLLPKLLSRAGGLPARHAVDKEQFRKGNVYVARPDYHLLIEGSRIRLSHGPKENRHRPAIDPLFRTAAQHGKRVIGIVLSGGLDDGSVGLRELKAMGGVAIAQDPAEALNPEMPRNALIVAKPDYCLKVGEIGALIPRLINGEFKREEMKEDVMKWRSKDKGMKPESKTIKPLKEINRKLGPPSVFVCPECNGPLWEIKEGDALLYRCLVGHSYAPEHFFAAQSEELERALWVALRTLEERTEVYRQLADRAKKHNQSLAGRQYSSHIQDNEKYARLIRELLENSY